MERVPSVYMRHWQQHMEFTSTTKDLVLTEEDMLASNHVCGNSACFAGWIALSPEFRADGGTVASTGAPYFNGLLPIHCYSGWEAISKWLGLESDAGRRFVKNLVLGDCECRDDLDHYVDYSNFYNKPWADVDKEDVLMKLRILREHVDFGTIAP
ncbi:hypothetical protein D3C86_1447330 [compost metagenome]